MKFKTSVNILVIGDVMIDHYIYGNCNRISPEAPVQIVEVKNDVYTLGGAGNVVKNIIAFKCAVNLISVVGVVENALLIANQLEKDGVSGEYLVKDSQRCTTVKSRVMVQSHQLIRLDREFIKPISDEVENDFMKIIGNQIANHDIVLLSDYNKGTLSSSLLSKVFKLCKAKGITTLVDPKGVDFSKYRGVNIIKPNKKEATLATGIQINDNNSLLAACVKIKEITNCDDVVITMSEEGVAMFTNNELTIIPTKALAVVDVTGAGDTVLACLGVALAGGNTLYDACDFANHAAAIVVSKVGSAVATFEEIEREFQRKSNDNDDGTTPL